MSATTPAIDISATKTIRLRTSPSWLPEKYRRRPQRIPVRFRPSKGERRVFRKKKAVLPSVWAARNRVVTYGPLKGSRWDNSFMPHMRGVMDASFFPSVEEIGNCKAPQTGSSAGTETMLAYAADMKPGDALILYPDRETARKRATDYLQPMFTESPRLRELLTGRDDDMASMRIKLMTMLVYMGWSGSINSVSNVSAKYLIGDECNKWELQPKKGEASTHKLFRDRSLSFSFGSKLWWISTPTDRDGYITVFMEELAQVVFVYGIPCPECGAFHVAGFEYIDFQGCRDPKEMEEKELARYVFPCCGAVESDLGRKRALQQGKWFERLGEEERKAGKFGRELFQCLREERPRRICFHSPAWISPLVSISKIASAFLRGLSSPADMHYFDNQIAARPHTPYRQNRQEDAILALRDDRPEGVVPGGGKVAALVAGVDTQTGSFVFDIRAFGYGMAQPSWQVRFGEVFTTEALVQVLFGDQYLDSAGLYYPVHLAVIDTGGDRTSEIYDFCRMHPGRVLGYKGSSHGRKAKPWTRTVIDRYPGTNVAIPGGVDLYVCDSHHYKDELAGRLRVKPGDPGEYRFHQGLTEDYAVQMCAEYVDDRRLWQCPKNRPNHFWDCCVMQLVGVDIMYLKYQRQEA